MLAISIFSCIALLGGVMLLWANHQPTGDLWIAVPGVFLMFSSIGAVVGLGICDAIAWWADKDISSMAHGAFALGGAFVGFLMLRLAFY